MKRRVFLAVAGGASFASALGCRTRAERETVPRPARTFVLVHGAWHGGWCWREVVAMLSVKGHRVFAPSLTGVGDRAHLFGPKVTLETYITCVKPPYQYLVPTAERIKKDPSWKFTTIDCGHDAMVIAPQMLTRLLMALG